MSFQSSILPLRRLFRFLVANFPLNYLLVHALMALRIIRSTFTDKKSGNGNASAFFLIHYQDISISRKHWPPHAIDVFFHFEITSVRFVHTLLNAICSAIFGRAVDRIIITNDLTISFFLCRTHDKSVCSQRQPTIYYLLFPRPFNLSTTTTSICE